MIKSVKKCHLEYWTKSETIKNLGDYLGEIMLNLAGIQVENEGIPTYFSVGTYLSSYWWELHKEKKVVWGGGSCGFNLPNISNNDLILAVRGPMTRDWLNLPKSTILGDPALLLPRIYQPINTNCGPILVENFHNKLEVPKNIKKISMKVTNENWRHIIDDIYSADFVLANSLHSAIIAHAYGRPWAFYSDRDHKTQRPLPLRWKDWFEFIGLPEKSLKPVDNLVDAIQWWDDYGDKIVNKELKELVDCCPWIALRKILK